MRGARASNSASLRPCDIACLRDRQCGQNCSTYHFQLSCLVTVCSTAQNDQCRCPPDTNPARKTESMTDIPAKAWLRESPSCTTSESLMVLDHAINIVSATGNRDGGDSETRQTRCSGS